MRTTSCLPKRLILALASVFLLSHMPLPAFAADLPKKQFVYKADSRKLPDVLQDLAATLQIPLVVAEGVDGTVNGKFDLTAPSFLDLMSSAYGLTWYFDGTVLFVYPARANQSKVLFLRDFSADRIERLLQSLRLGDKRYPLRYDATEKTLVVSGPPRHLELVDSMVDAISQRGREEGRRVVKVFPLRYASANDQTIGGATVTGLVTMLNNVYGNGSKGAGEQAQDAGLGGGPKQLSAMAATYGAQGGGDPLSATMNSQTEKRITKAASTFSLNSAGGMSEDRSAYRTATNVSSVPLDDDRPVFTSDDANNAVIVMGLPHRMAVYADLIKQLDVAADLIELEAMIIDVRHDDAASIGVNWTAKGRTTEANVSGIGSIAAAAGSVFQLTTLSADLSRQLMLTVNALQQQGRARVVARPRVVGVANRLATMRDLRSASVRVAGNLSSSLYAIETGTQIEVIPRKVQIDGIQAIRLSLAIQDGSFDANTVDAIPIVKRTGISTEAYVGEGEGLLIGGISSESDSSTHSGLPGLSKVPFFGALFRTTEDQASRRERLFLITPRILTLARKTPIRAEPAAFIPGDIAPTEASFGLARGKGVTPSSTSLKFAKTK